MSVCGSGVRERRSDGRILILLMFPFGFVTVHDVFS